MPNCARQTDLELTEMIAHIVKPNDNGKEISWDVRINSPDADECWVAQRNAAQYGRLVTSVLKDGDGRVQVYHSGHTKCVDLITSGHST